MNDTALIQLDTARHALAECKTAMEAKQIADVAEAARVYLERTNASAETVNRATEIRLLAERQMGAFLKTMPKATGVRTVGGGSGAGSAVTEPPAQPPTLREIGITKKQSATAQKLADIPADEFRERIAVAKAGGEKLSLAKVVEQTRRPSMQFSMRSWKAQAKSVIRSWMNAVPEDSREDAIQFLTETVRSINTAQE